MSSTQSPSIEQAAKLNFKQSFLELAQQTKSALAGSPAVIYGESMGKTNNTARIGRIELAKVNTRNPDKAYGEYAVDNRRYTKSRWTRTITIDAKHDVNELLKDPTSDLLKQLWNAKERVIDRVIARAALGDVLIGAPDAAPTVVSAVNDGVITVDASAGLTYAKIQEITQNFINADIPYAMYKGSLIAISGKENTNLMGEDEFINSDYITGKPVMDGIQMQAGTYGIVQFAGSVNGGITVLNPVLPEGSTLRDCMVLAPESVEVAMEVADISVERNPDKVNSNDITIDFWIGAMRTEGVRVQKLQTTL